MTETGAASPRKGLAIASLVLGIVGVPTLGLGGVGALLGIVLGAAALVKAGRAPRQYGGRGMAIAGIVLSAISVVVMPIWFATVAAMFFPDLLREPVAANESAAI